MTDGEWTIRGPDGTEYEIRPKRKQTGWICKACGDDICVQTISPVDMPGGSCPHGFDDMKWQPFYGKVVE